MSKTSPASPGKAACEKLCLACGLCCDGTIFADVKLQARDSATRLRWLGVPVLAASTKGCGPGFTQPCPALNGGGCKIYAERPQYCRQFDCLLLKDVKAGETTPARALKLIQKARGQADEARHLMQGLGDQQDCLPLGLRFRRLSQELEKHPPDSKNAATYGQLTLVMHDLTLQLSEHFYTESA